MYIKITKQLAVGAEYYETSRSWGHKAHLYLGRTENGNGNLILKEKVRYYNRTWESYKFETVLKNLYFEAKKKNLLSAYHLRLFKKMIDNGGKVEAKRIKQEFKTVAMVASLGSIFGKTQKELSAIVNKFSATMWGTATVHLHTGYNLRIYNIPKGQCFALSTDGYIDKEGFCSIPTSFKLITASFRIWKDRIIISCNIPTSNNRNRVGLAITTSILYE